MKPYYIKSLIVPRDIPFNEFRLEENEGHDPDNFQRLPHLSKVNIFVGPNNSRKSRFIRLLAAQHDYIFEANDSAHHVFVTMLLGFQEEIVKLLQRYGLTNYAGLKQQFLQLRIEKPFPIGQYVQTRQLREIDLATYFDFIQGLGGIQSYEGRQLSDKRQEFLQDDLREIARAHRKKLTEAAKQHSSAYQFKKIYIPTLRGVRQFRDIDQDPYEQKTLSDYFPTSHDQESFKIFSGYGLYKENAELASHSNRAERDKKRSFEKFLSSNFYSDKEVEIISAWDTKVVHMVVAGEEGRKIQDIGDGIQQQVILFFSMFQRLGEKTIFFIEEPELFMHPGMQRQFLESIYSQKEFDGFQFFLTTHSNHFLDMTIDYNNVSIFRCDKVADPPESNTSYTRITNVDSPDGSVLASLGVRNSSVFLVNCTVWVEGVTDRRYIRHFLKLYQEWLIKKGKIEKHEILKEDLHYAFIEYGGSNITHWSEDNQDQEAINVRRLTGKMFLIADKDDKRKQAQHRQLKKMLGDRFFPLPVREIENLVTEDILGEVVSRYEKRDLGDKEKPAYDNYKKEYLGKYINELLGEHMEREGGYAAESGTMKDKNRFCDKILELTGGWEDLSSDAQGLIKIVYDFIKKENQDA